MTDVAVVLVTFNRLTLLRETLDALADQSHPVSDVYVVNNASTDGTNEFLDAYNGPLTLHHLPMIDNLGGAGGFSVGVDSAYRDGAQWLWLMDDDVLPQPQCLEQLLAQGDPVMACLREDRDGRLVERASLQYDLQHPWVGNPRRHSIEDLYADSAAVPDRVPLAIATFEGLFVQRQVVTDVGLPDPRYFIFLDDVDYCLRIRQAGYQIRLAAKAILRRQLPMVDVTELNWKTPYVYRNFFYLHFVFGEHWSVRLKPAVLLLAAILVKPFLPYGFKQLSIIWRAYFDARKMLNREPRWRRLPDFCHR